MVRGQYLSQTELFRASQDEVDEMLISNLGLTRNNINYVRSISDPLEKITAAAKLVYESTEDPISVTIDTVAAIAMKRWKGRYSSRGIYRHLSKVFDEERKQLEIESGLKLNNMHLLRKSIGAYDGNLEEAKKKWRKIKVSREDLLRSVRLPLKLGHDESRILGVFWGDGSIDRIRGRPSYLALGGGKGDFRFYEEYVANDVSRIFNLEVPVKKIHLRRSDYLDNVHEYTMPRMELCSHAVLSWLERELRFPTKPDKTYVKLPAKQFDKRGFIEGIIDSMGYLSGYSITLGDKDESFMNELYKLAKSAGLYCYGPRKKLSKNLNGTFGERFILNIFRRELRDFDIRNPRLL
jgi:hypothetical protein